MSGRHQDSSARRRQQLLAASTLGVVLAGTGALLFSGGSASAAAPKPNYKAGSDTATFTVTGMLDRNCLVSVGGTKVYVRPGDKIDFRSSLAGIDVSKALPDNPITGLLGQTLTGSDVAGLNVSAVLDAKSSHPVRFSVAGGKTTTLSAAKLSKGTHTLDWTAKSLALVPSLNLPSVPLSNNDLKSGASLSWSGGVYVTTSAPDCKLSVGTPKVKVSAGPVKITVPPVNVTAPVDPRSIASKLPKIPTPGRSSTAKAKPKPKSSTASVPVTGGEGQLPVPARVVPLGEGGTGGGGTVGGGAGGGYGVNQGGGGTGGYAPLSLGGKASPVSDNSAASPSATTKKTADLAANQAPSAQLPVVLAILAIVALSLVGATYARLFLLRRKG